VTRGPAGLEIKGVRKDRPFGRAVVPRPVAPVMLRSPSASRRRRGHLLVLLSSCPPALYPLPHGPSHSHRSPATSTSCPAMPPSPGSPVASTPR
jgi:hypothetical protein